MLERRQKIESMLRSDPADSLLNYSLAMEWLSEGENEAAIAQFRKTIEVDPDNHSAYFQIGQIYNNAGEIEQSREALTAGIAVAQRVNDAHAVGEMTEYLEML